MSATVSRQQLVNEIQHIPDDHLDKVFDVLHYFRLGLESSARPAAPTQHRQPSPRLARQGARLNGDDMAPAIPQEDWGALYEGTK